MFTHTLTHTHTHTQWDLTCATQSSRSQNTRFPLHVTWQPWSCMLWVYKAWNMRAHTYAVTWTRWSSSSKQSNRIHLSYFSFHRLSETAEKKTNPAGPTDNPHRREAFATWLCATHNHQSNNYSRQCPVWHLSLVRPHSKENVFFLRWFYCS